MMSDASGKSGSVLKLRRCQVTRELSDDPATAEDRRLGVRVRTVFQTARVVTEDQSQFLGLLRNISPCGMMIETFVPIRTGAQILIEPKMFDPVRATVRWSDGRRVGVELHQPVQLDAYLSSRATLAAAHRPRGPRVSTDLRARLRVGVIWHLVRLLDISQGGAKVATDLSVSLGEEVELDLEGVAPFVGHVCWVRGARIGITFVQPVQLATIAQWVAKLASPAP